MIVIRRGMANDLEAVRQIQSASPAAAHWDPGDYLRYDLFVAILDNRVAGFLVSRFLGSWEGQSECEILNLAVAPPARRRGIARRLIEALQTGFSGTIFLEVRESNLEARKFYKSLNFEEVSLRSEYYLSPTEAAIVMKFHSC